MENRNTRVMGSYSNRDEALGVVKELNDEGYEKDDITVYTNEESNLDGDLENNNKDQSAWDKIKDAFTSDTYNYETRKIDEDYNKDTDFLYPYRNDIKNGNVVIVADDSTNNKAHDSEIDQNIVGHTRVNNNEMANDALAGGRDFDRADDDMDNTRN